MFLWKSKAAAPPLHAHDAPSKPRSPLPGPGGCGGVNPPGAMPTRNGSPVALYKPPAPTSIRRRRVPELGISLSLTEATRQTSPRGWGPRGHRRHKRHGLGEIPARISAPQCAWDYGPNRTALRREPQYVQPGACANSSVHRTAVGGAIASSNHQNPNSS